MPKKPVDAAVVLRVGPLIDDTDFKTLEEAIAYDESGMDLDFYQETADGITKTDITLTSGGANDWTHKGSGIYEVEITAAQNDTEGTIYIVGECDGVIPFMSPVYECVPAQVYNSLVTGSDTLDVQVAGMDANTVTSSAIATNAITASAIATNAITDAKIASDAITAAKIADGAIDAATFAAGAIDASAIATDAITAAKVADGTIDAATFAAGAINAAAIATDAIDADAIAADALTAIEDEILDAATSGHQGAGTVGKAITDGANLEVFESEPA